MNHRKEYVWQNGNLGDKLMDVGSYIPLFGLVFDNTLNKRVESYICKKYSEWEVYSEINKFREKALAKDSYHFFSSLLVSALLLKGLVNVDPDKKIEKLEGPDSLENIIKVIGAKNNTDSQKTFNYTDYFA